ncbi:pyridoxamine 5'-phosphate oxidase family protein [Marinobacterium nitratireducens]|uniref:pyridoxamine 5'-phosphate oxidase family protein n=1 Tax=Marinobacterium nitratireducens TaxID=518897 RepID=UPI001E410A11|nr:pyridoxamine 5'-phosphate oxidase family protein [Marinobacterium nitratireducens]
MLAEQQRLDGGARGPRPASLHERHSFDRFTQSEADFIAARDSFYLSTVSETGWPYIQHRGGPQGFLKVLDERTLAFADYRGNRQYISAGNATSNRRACLFLMDYPNRARLKMYVHIETIAPESDPDLLEVVASAEYRAKIERIFRLRLEGFDWNCPQHIRPRFTEQEIAGLVRPLQERLALLESENVRLRSRLENSGE